MNINWKLILGKYAKILISAFLSGIMISIGGSIYLGASSYGYKFGGALLFATGLLVICLYGYHLFTGKVGYIPENNFFYVFEVLMTLIGNYLGTMICALLLRCTRLMEDGNAFKTALDTMMVTKENDGVLSLIILAMFCGILMYIAVNTYKKAEQPIAKFLTLFVCVAGFILAGFEHSIADMFYFMLYKPFNGDLTLKLLYIIIGNSVGCMLIPLLNKLRNKIKGI